MKHLTNKELEILALSTEKNNLNLNHINDCFLCKKRYNEVLEFYEILYSELDKPASPLVNSLSESISNKYIILQPYNEEIDLTEYEKENTLLLAAESLNEAVNNFTITTLTSKKHRLIVKFQDDFNEQLTRVYIIAEDPKLYSHVLIVMKVNDETKYYPTDADGIAAINFTDKREWVNENVIILLPSITLNIVEAKVIDGIIADETNYLKFDRRTGIILLNNDTSLQQKKILYVYSNKFYRLDELNENSFQPPQYPGSELVEIKIFN